jgi:hypothetical protein
LQRQQRDLGSVEPSCGLTGDSPTNPTPPTPGLARAKAVGFRDFGALTHCQMWICQRRVYYYFGSTEYFTDVVSVLRSNITVYTRLRMRSFPFSHERRSTRKNGNCRECGSSVFVSLGYAGDVLVQPRALQVWLH